MNISLTDATGDTLILEWIDGKLITQHARQYHVTANEPGFDWEVPEA